MKVTFLTKSNTTETRHNVKTLSMCVVAGEAKNGRLVGGNSWRVHLYASNPDKDELLSPDTYIPVIIESEDD